MRFVDMELARRLELAAHEPLAPGEDTQARPDGSARIAVGGGIAVFTGIDSPATQAEGLGLHGPVSEDEFTRLEEFFRSRGSSVFIEVCPMADPSFIESLGKRGYRVVEFSNMLLRKVDPAETFTPAAPGIIVRPISPGEEQLHAETVARGFADHFAVTDEMIAMIQGFFSRSSGFVAYFVLVDGKVAGGGALKIRNRIAGLFGASTLPEFRNRGAQSAVISARLEIARTSGCDLAMSITQPSSVSQRNLERAGFSVVYTRAKFVRAWEQ
ncbi:MAG: GNAT family N-acetyltransferase [Candidatus Acidiferrales bacterium]